MISGCQNNTEKLILENKISTAIPKKNQSVLDNKKFSIDKVSFDIVLLLLLIPFHCKTHANFKNA